MGIVHFSVAFNILAHNNFNKPFSLWNATPEFPNGYIDHHYEETDYRSRKDKLVAIATSELGSNANLSIDAPGPMI